MSLGLKQRTPTVRCHCLMFSVVIWLYICLCCFDSVSCLVDVPVIICSDLGDDRYICYIHMLYVICTCHYMSWLGDAGQLWKTQDPCTEASGQHYCASREMDSAAVTTNVPLPPNYNIGGGKESLSSCFECMDVDTACLFLIGLPWMCELTVFCASSLRLSWYYYSQWWPRTQNSSLSCLASGSTVIGSQMSFEYE